MTPLASGAPRRACGDFAVARASGSTCTVEPETAVLRLIMTTPLRPTFTRRRILLTGLALSPVVLGANGCGYILYPDRKGRTGGNLDVPVFVIDLIWLIPGIIPGVICLIVDFTTGCIYEDRGRRSSRTSTSPIGKKRFASGTVVVDGEVVASADIAAESRAALTWARAVDLQVLKERGHLVFRRPDGAKAEVLVRELL